MLTSMSVVGSALSVIARALVPLVGVVFLDWPAPKVLIVYLADTAAAYYALLAVLAVRGTSSGAPANPSSRGPARDTRTAIRAMFLPLPMLLLVGFFFGVLPLFVMIDLQDVQWRELLADRRLWQAVVVQCALALGLIVTRLLDRGAMASAASDTAFQNVCISSRWLAMVFIGFFLAPVIPRIVYGPLLIATYGLLTAALELAPGRVVAWAMRVVGKPVAPHGRDRP